MNITIIGNGNTATVLGKKLKRAGHQIVQVVGRNKHTVEKLADELGAAFTTAFHAIDPGADLYLLAVSDNAVGEVVNRLPVTDKMVVHTAASVSKDLLQKISNRFGVFYPLQSLKKEVAQLPPVPLLIDAGDEETLQRLLDLAHTITNQVFVANDKKRMKMHLAAVMANNFTNHLFTLVENYCRQEGVEFSFLLPLINETVNRLEHISPSTAQTGPAVRNDTATIAKHLALLEKAPNLKRLYELFTQSIQESKP